MFPITPTHHTSYRRCDKEKHLGQSNAINCCHLKCEKLHSLILACLAAQLILSKNAQMFNDLMVNCVTAFQQTFLFLAAGARKVRTLHQPAVSWLCSPEGCSGTGEHWDSSVPPQLPPEGHSRDSPNTTPGCVSDVRWQLDKKGMNMRDILPCAPRGTL